MRLRRLRDAELTQREIPPSADSDLSWREASAVLHDELDRLPEHYRKPLLLCYREVRVKPGEVQDLGDIVVKTPQKKEKDE
jgi:DNA-directed RNA polymerase specialized sigma24 family protein